MYKEVGLKVFNKKTGEECRVFQGIARERWSKPGDFLLEHTINDYSMGKGKDNRTWSFLCDSSFFTRVIDFLDWELKCPYCGTWYTFEYFKHLSQLCDICLKGRD